MAATDCHFGQSTVDFSDKPHFQRQRFLLFNGDMVYFLPVDNKATQMVGFIASVDISVLLLLRQVYRHVFPGYRRCRFYFLPGKPEI
jgi:hypothetical protein